MKKDIKSVYTGAGMLFYGAFLTTAFSGHLALACAAGILLAILGIVFLVAEEGYTVQRAVDVAVALLVIVVVLMAFLAVSAIEWNHLWVISAVVLIGNACVVLGVVMTIVSGSIYMAAEDPDFTPPTLL